MYVIDVIPLSRTGPGVLTYRSSSDMPIGTIVSITIRKTETQGIVIDSMPVTEAKEILKRARFLLSKSIPTASGILPAEVLKAAAETALYHATTSGAVLTAMFSEQVRAGVTLPTDALSNGNGFTRTTCERSLPDRAAAYRTRIKNCIDSDTAALLIVPTVPELAYWKDTFKSFKPLVISGALTGAKRAEALSKARLHTGLIIATPSFAWLPIQKLSLVILDRISAGTYTLPKRPYLSVPYAAEALTKERAVQLIIGDYPLPLEYRDFPEAGLEPSQAPIAVIDARSKKPDEGPTQRQAQTESEDLPWAALPKEVVQSIRKEIEEDGRVIVLAARKGYAPGVVCRDCGQAQHDERGMAYSFSQANGERIFRTSDGHIIKAARKCQRCESWNLMPLGIGIERIEEELRTAFPEAKIITVPPESLTSLKKARTAVQEAQEAGSIVVGTEALLPWLYAGMQNKERLPLGVIASADSLLSQPFWRARERFVRLAYFLRSMTREEVLITRHPDDTAVDAASRPESDAFWQEESGLRRALSYPPYGTIITLTLEGASKRVQEEAEALRERFEAYGPSVLSPRQLQGSLSRSVVVLTLPHGTWPTDALSGELRALSPAIRIRVDPESIW